MDKNVENSYRGISVPTRKGYQERLSQRGLPPEAVQLILDASAGRRHQYRVAAAAEVLLSIAAGEAVSLPGVDEDALRARSLQSILEETPNPGVCRRDGSAFGVDACRWILYQPLGDNPDFDQHAAVAARACAVAWADAVGVGGWHDLEGIGTARVPTLEVLGSGRKHASDGDAWDAAIGDAARLLEVCIWRSEERGQLHLAPQTDGHLLAGSSPESQVVVTDVVPPRWRRAVAGTAILEISGEAPEGRARTARQPLLSSGSSLEDWSAVYEHADRLLRADRVLEERVRRTTPGRVHLPGVGEFDLHVELVDRLVHPLSCPMRLTVFFCGCKRAVYPLACTSDLREILHLASGRSHEDLQDAAGSPRAVHVERPFLLWDASAAISRRARSLVEHHGAYPPEIPRWIHAVEGDADLVFPRPEEREDVKDDVPLDFVDTAPASWSRGAA